MKQEIKSISLEEIAKIELIEDDNQSQRFNDLVRKVVNLPKKELDRRIAQEREAKENALSHLKIVI